MVLTLELPQDLEKQLALEAERAGLPLEQYALRLLQGGKSETRLKAGAQVVDFWRREGLLGSLSEVDDSQEYARQIRHRAEHRFEG